jgi:hypothetical protein
MTNRSKMKVRSTPYSLAILVSLLLCLAASVPANDLKQELAQARAATAKYHDLTRAEADGYVFDHCEEGEGCHWFNYAYYDGAFDPAYPEALNYIDAGNGKWRLVAVEYIVLGSDPPPPAPEGFSGDEDVWRFFTEGYTDWELTAWIWLDNPDGIFAWKNPRLEE